MKSTPLYFPPQKISTAKKTEKWYKECIDGAEDLAILRHDVNTSDHYKMQVWEDLDNDIINESEIEKVFNPMGLKDAVFPAAIKNYPLSVPKIDLLQGEAVKRKFDWKVLSKNEDAYSHRTDALQQEIMNLVMSEIQAESVDEEEMQKKIEKVSKYFQYDYKDTNELYATRTLEYLYREQDLKRKFFKGIRKALVKGKEIYRVEGVSGEPVVIDCDPKNVYSLRTGDSHKIEDSDIIVEITYEPIGAVIDEFHDDLTPKQIDTIEEGIHRLGQKSEGGVLNHTALQPILWASAHIGGEGDGVDSLKAAHGYNLPYDAEGNVRVLRVKWVGRRKIGKVTYYDEITGDEEEKLVSEKYKVNELEGEKVKWIWINEAYEGVRLAQDIYIKYGPRKIQMRHFDNPSKCFLGYVGTDYGKSLMSRMEPYQYLYNVYMRRLELAIAKYKGPIYELDLSKKPDEWSEDMWMYYGDVLGWMVIDSFNEGKKGQATGKLAGSFNTTGKVLDANGSNYIQQLLMMLQHIEDQMGKIVGVNEQRQGQIDNRETVGGVERAVTQSSHITEKWFFIHDETKKRVLLALLDTAKQLWKNNKSKKLQYIMDDMSRAAIEINGEDFASSEFDIFISDSSDDLKIRNTIEQLSHAFVQNGGSLTLPIKVLRNDSITQMAKTIEEEEIKMREQQQEMEQKQLEAQQQAQQAQQATEQSKQELEKYKIDSESNTKIEVALIQAEAGTNVENGNEDTTLDQARLNLDQKKLSLEEKKESNQNKLGKDKHVETVRHNKATESISKNKPKTTSKK